MQDSEIFGNTVFSACRDFLLSHFTLFDNRRPFGLRFLAGSSSSSRSRESSVSVFGIIQVVECGEEEEKKRKRKGKPVANEETFSAQH